MLTPTILLNLFLEKIRQETLHDRYTSISIGGRPICNLRFADDVDLMGVSNGELQDLTNRLLEREMAYEIEVNTEKSKIVINSTNDSNADIYSLGSRMRLMRSLVTSIFLYVCESWLHACSIFD